MKNTFADDLPGERLNENLKEYFKAWFSMFLRHPGVYLEATLHGASGYYYPFHICKRKSYYLFFNRDAMTEKFNVHFVNSEEVRKNIMAWAQLWLKLPVVSQMLAPGMFTWILLIAAGYLIYRRRWEGILALAAPALNVAVCVASPVNGLMRYAMPLLACLPAVVSWCLVYEKPGKSDTVTEQKKTKRGIIFFRKNQWDIDK